MGIEWGSLLVQSVITAVLSGSAVGVILTAIFTRRTERISAEVRQQFQRGSEEISAEVKRGFEEQLLRFHSNMQWKEQSLAQLLGPVNMQLDRVYRAFKRWDANNHYLEDRIIREGNTKARDLLLQNGHLIPQDLLGDAGLLIGHYDRWLEQFDRVRGPDGDGSEQPFVFTYDFPSGSAKRFEARFREFWEDLYGPVRSDGDGPEPAGEQEGGSTTIAHGQ